MIVGSDYFTKWVEAKSTVKIEGGDMIRFVREHIIYKVGYPHAIFIDNGMQLSFATPNHSQSNGQAESSI